MSSLPFANKVAIITGGTKGIGAAIATQLHSGGASVVITYSSDAASAEKTISSLRGNHSSGSDGESRVLALQNDAGKSADAESLVRKTVETFGKIDFLLLNAAYVPMKGLEDTTETDFERTMTTNIKGPYFLTQKVLPYIPAGGRVILFSTSLTAVSQIAPHYLLYLTSKGAIEQMVRVLAKDLGQRGVTVNAVSPGPTMTESFLRGKTEDTLKMITGWVPLGKLGQPDDIAGGAVMLCGEQGRWINGQVIRVNGGMA